MIDHLTSIDPYKLNKKESMTRRNLIKIREKKLIKEAASNMTYI